MNSKIRMQILFVLFLVIVVVLCSHMAAETWGMLAKSQTDSTTIDQAIAAAISAHNDDATAHTAPGQAIYLHTTNPVIDHPPGSIPVDKVSNLGAFYTSNFESLDAFSTSGLVSQSFPGVSLSTGLVSGGSAQVNSDGTAEDASLDFSLFPVFQLNVLVTPTTASQYYFLRGAFVDDSTDLCMGFNFDGTHFTGFVKIGTTRYTVALSTPDTHQHTYRVFVDPTTQDLVFFIDGVQVGTIAKSTYYSAAVAFGLAPGAVNAYIKSTASLNKVMVISGLLFGNTPT